MVLRKKLQILVLLGLLLPVLTVGSAVAQTDTTREDESTATTEQARDERLEERKERLQTRLTFAQQTRLRGRCQAAQVILSAYLERLGRLETNRTAAHAKILTKLNEIVAKVGDQTDTTELKASIETLKTKTDAFADQLDDYQLAIEDLAKMDCVDDPTAFKATLETVRTQRVELAKVAADIRTYIVKTIKPQLQEIRQALKAGSETE